jgi:hypothetical protein
MRRHATPREWVGFLSVLPLRATQLLIAQIKGLLAF